MTVHTNANALRNVSVVLWFGMIVPIHRGSVMQIRDIVPVQPSW